MPPASDFLAGQEQPGLDHRVRVEGHALDALIEQPVGEIRMVRRTLSADAHVFILAAAGLDGHGQQGLHRVVPLVEDVCDQGGVPVQAEGELRHIVGADGHAVEMLQVAVGQQRVCGQLRHHDDLQAVLAPGQAVLRQQFHHLAALLHGAHERHHDLDVGQAHLGAHSFQCPAFELEAGLVDGVHVAGGAAEPEHRVLLVGFISLAAYEVGVLVGLEIRQAHDDRVRVESGGDRRDALRQFRHEELHRLAVAGHLFLHRFAGVGVQLVELEQRPRVNADHAVDDEFQARQADAVIRDAGEVERPVRVADVHHDLHRDIRQGGELDLRLFVFELAVVDVALVALGAGDRDLAAVGDLLRGVAAADHRRYAQFPGDDGGMAGASAPVRDDGRGALHDRLPVRIGHVGDQHVAVLHPGHLLDAADDLGGADADLLADAAAAAEDVRPRLQGEALQRTPAAALHRLRTRLQDVDSAVLAVLAPLDVHRAAVVLLDGHCLFRQFDDVLVAEAEALRLRLVHVHRLHGMPRGGVVAVDHLDGLAAEAAAQDRVVAVLQRLLVDVELVRVHGALYHGLAEPVRGGDEYGAPEAGLGVEREHHAGSADVAADHVLDARRKGHQGVIEAVVHPVGDRPVVEQRGEYLVDGLDEPLEAFHVEEGLLLSRERGVGQVLGGGRGAHRHGDILAAGHRLPGRGDVLAQPRGQGGIHDPLPDFAAGGGKILDVVDVQRIEAMIDPVGETFVAEEIPVGLCGGGEAAGNGDAGGGQVGYHLPEGCVLAAHPVHVAHAQCIERNYIRLQSRLPCVIDPNVHNPTTLATNLAPRIHPWAKEPSFFCPTRPVSRPRRWVTACSPNSTARISGR